jgi:prepilin-type N-terminal cleavage/methylation domain-containing protein
MNKRFAFTMIELIFVIVIMGILAKFGMEFLAQSYKSFLYENVNHQLQSDSESAVERIASKLQYRIKDSVVARKDKNGTATAIGSATGDDYIVLEWIGFDSAGFRGKTLPYWSGIIDLDDSNATILTSPDTNTTQEDNLTKVLSNGTTDISKTAIYFIGSNSDAETDYGWDGNLTKIDAQQAAIHPIKSVAGNIQQFQSSTGTDFSGVDIYEYYKLAWSAYAIVMEDYNATGDETGTLKLYYNYRPWIDRGDGTSEQLEDGNSTILMEHVSTFRFKAIGSLLQIQVCTKSNLLKHDGGDYSLCKEKTIF